MFAAFCLAPQPGVEPRPARVGLTVPRALGKAVIRNRVKRRMREALRQDWAEMQPGWDVVINPRKAVLEAPFVEIQREVKRLITRCAK